MVDGLRPYVVTLEDSLTATEATPGTITASVKVTNLTGHKLPTGYPEGRRMWVQIEALDAGGTPFWQSGMLDQLATR